MCRTVSARICLSTDRRYYWAISNNNVDLVELLLLHGADANKTHASGGKWCDVSSLSLAAHPDSLSVTKMLLGHGAPTRQSGAVQVAAEECGSVEVLETLASHDADVHERLNVDNIYHV